MKSLRRQVNLRSRKGGTCITLLACLCCTGHSLTLDSGACAYGVLPGTMVPTSEDSYEWRIFNQECQLTPLVEHYLGLNTQSAAPAPFETRQMKGISMLLLGDSVDRAVTNDVHDLVEQYNNDSMEVVLKEHWRSCIKLPQLEMVYQFLPGSHADGPFHDGLSAAEFSPVHALPKGFELHKSLTGREKPNVVVFSNLIWDLGRWLYIGGTTDPSRTQHQGKPMLRDQEYLPMELIEDWMQSTELQLKRIEMRVDDDALLIYHNAAFAKMVNCLNGTQHIQNGMGKRTHLAQLNAAARQVMAANPRWHMVDYGLMSETFLGGNHIRDLHHPKPFFLLQALNIFLNLQQHYGTPPRPVMMDAKDVPEYDAEQEVQRVSQALEEEKRRVRDAQSSGLYKGIRMLVRIGRKFGGSQNSDR